MEINTFNLQPNPQEVKSDNQSVNKVQMNNIQHYNNVSKTQSNTITSIDKKMSLNQFIVGQIKFLKTLQMNGINLFDYVNKYKTLIISFKPTWSEKEFSLSFDLSSLTIYTKTPKWLISSFIDCKNITGISYK